MRFKLLYGLYSEGRTPEGLPKLYRPGDIFESKFDLVKRYNSRGSQKFLRLDEAAEQPPAANGQPDTLDGLSIEELRRYAEQEEIDLGKARTKAEILTIIRKG